MTTYTRMGIIQTWKVEGGTKRSLSTVNVNLFPLVGGLTMHKCIDSDKLHVRINKAIGQLNAIQKMIDENAPCEQVLVQINAVKGAMHRIGLIILQGHLSHCVREGIEAGDAEETIANCSEALERFSRLS